MNTTLILIAQTTGQGGPMSMIIMMAAILVIIWSFTTRPQQKKQKGICAFQNALSTGDSVVTGGGIYGTVKHADMTTNKVEAEIACGVIITVDKNHVSANVQASQQGQNK